MTTPITITLSDNNTSFNIFPLETNGPRNRSVLRSVLKPILSPHNLGNNYFVVGGDISARFTAGFIFDVTDENGSFITPISGTYTTNINSVFNVSATEIPVNETIPRGFFEIVGVTFPNIWIIKGNFAQEFESGNFISITENGDSGVFTVASATNVGPNTEIIVSETIAVTATSQGFLSHREFPILSHVPGLGGSVEINGDLTNRFPPGSKFVLTPSQTFTVQSSVFGAGTTTITVDPGETVPVITTERVNITALPIGFISYTVPAEKTIPTGVATSFSLPGRGMIEWGQKLEQSIVRIAESSAHSVPPPAPLNGQLWYNSNDQLMYFYNSSQSYLGNFVKVIGVNSGLGQWTLEGNQTLYITPGSRFAVFGNTGIDADPLYANKPVVTYEVVTSTLSGLDTIVTINSLPLNPVDEPSIPSTATPNGLIYSLNDWTVFFDTSNPSLFNNLNMNGNLITNVGNPVNAGDALNLGFADNRYVNVTGDTMTGFLTLNADPTLALHAATKQYVDNIAAGIVTKPAVEIVAVSNLAATYNNGVLGVGATLTATSNGPFPTIDGVTLTVTTPGLNGVLVAGQTNPAENGRYNLTQVGDGSNPWILTRCGLCDQANEIPGSYTFIKQGTTYAGSGWVQTVNDPLTFVVGTDAIFVTQFTGGSSYTAGNGLLLIGNQFNVLPDTVTNTTFINGSNQIAVDFTGLNPIYLALNGSNIPPGGLNFTAPSGNPGGDMIFNGGDGVGVGSGGDVGLIGGDAPGSGFGGNLFLSAGTSVSGTDGQTVITSRGGINFRGDNFTSPGDAQTTLYTLLTETTNNTITEMFLDGTSGTRRMVLPDNGTWKFRIDLVARRTDASNERAAYTFDGCIDRISGPASVTIVGPVYTTIVAEDIPAWNATVDADITHGSLRIRVQGETAKVIRWVAFVSTVQVTS